MYLCKDTKVAGLVLLLFLLSYLIELPYCLSSTTTQSAQRFKKKVHQYYITIFLNSSGTKDPLTCHIISTILHKLNRT